MVKIIASLKLTGILKPKFESSFLSPIFITKTGTINIIKKAKKAEKIWEKIFSGEIKLIQLKTARMRVRIIIPEIELRLFLRKGINY
jgi:hypothetical protein